MSNTPENEAKDTEQAIAAALEAFNSDIRAANFEYDKLHRRAKGFILRGMHAAQNGDKKESTRLLLAARSHAKQLARMQREARFFYEDISCMNDELQTDITCSQLNAIGELWGVKND